MEIKTFGKSEKYVNIPKYPKIETLWSQDSLWGWSEWMWLLCFVCSDINSSTCWSLMPTAGEWVLFFRHPQVKTSSSGQNFSHEWGFELQRSGDVLMWFIIKPSSNSYFHRSTTRNAQIVLQKSSHKLISTSLQSHGWLWKFNMFSLPCFDSEGGKVLFTKGAESAILPYATGGEIETTRLHVDEFALVSLRILFSSTYTVHCTWVLTWEKIKMSVFSVKFFPSGCQFCAQVWIRKNSI